MPLPLMALAVQAATGAIPSAPPTASASSPGARGGVDVHVTLSVAKDRGTIPFEYAGGLVVFKGEVAGKPAWIVIDNGSDHCLVDERLAASSGLTIGPVSGTIMTTGGHPIAKRRVDDVSLVVPRSIEGRLPMAAVDLAPLSRALGRPIGGVVGHDILSHLVWLTDRRHGEMFLAPGSFALHGSPAPTPITITTTPEPHDQIGVIVAGVPLTLSIDTGSQNGVSLSPAAWARVRPKDAQVFTRPSRGASGISEDLPSSRVPLLEIGGTKVEDVEVQVRPWPASYGDGTIGMGVLARFSFVLDLPKGQLWLIPAPTDTSTLPAPVIEPPASGRTGKPAG